MYLNDQISCEIFHISCGEYPCSRGENNTLELRKLKNNRSKTKTRDITINDYDNMEFNEVKRKDCSRRMDAGVLRSDMVSNKYVQDSGKKIQIVGSDVEALYPYSLYKQFQNKEDES